MTETNLGLDKDRSFLAAIEDGLEVSRKTGDYPNLQKRTIADMEKAVPGLGRYLKDAMNQAKTPEDADIIFSSAYTFYELGELLKMANAGKK